MIRAMVILALVASTAFGQAIGGVGVTVDYPVLSSVIGQALHGATNVSWAFYGVNRRNGTTAAGATACFIRTGSAGGLYVYSANGQTQWMVAARSVTNDALQSCRFGWPTGRYATVSATIDYAAKSIAVYVDGALVVQSNGLAFASNSYVQATSTSADQIMGGNAGKWEGVCQRVVVWRHGLSAQQHAMIHASRFRSLPTRGLVVDPVWGASAATLDLIGPANVYATIGGQAVTRCDAITGVTNTAATIGRKARML